MFTKELSSLSTKNYMLHVLTRYNEAFVLLVLMQQIGLLIILVHYIKELKHLFNYQFPDFFPFQDVICSLLKKLWWYNINGNYNVRMEFFVEFLKLILAQPNPFQHCFQIRSYCRGWILGIPRVSKFNYSSLVLKWECSLYWFHLVRMLDLDSSIF